ncbi:MAG: DUF2857 family protein [Gammaproteobacteria bacterium]|nr:DUF2857 family protein [Gammaproteobacteria bacterium]
MRDLEYNIQVQILMAFKTAAESGQINFFKARGLGQQTIDNLKALPTSALMQIAHYQPFDLTCSEAIFNTRLESGIKKDTEQKLVRKAIRLGASRKSLRAFVVMSSKNYADIREEVSFYEKRDKPTKIDDKQLIAIGHTHNNIKAQEKKLGIKYSALEILIKLSEAHNIEINQLYNYYYVDNADLFDGERSLR